MRVRILFFIKRRIAMHLNKVLYRATLLVLLLAMIPSVVFAGTITWTDGTNTITAETPNSYGSCAATSDVVTISGLPAGFTLSGSINVDFVDYQAGRVNYSSTAVSHTSDGMTPFTQAVNYPPIAQWHLSDPVNGTYEIHIDLSIEVRDSNGATVGWVGNSAAPGTIGPGQDWDIWCHQTPPPPPSVGTGTPGYWKNHPEAWPGSITIGGLTYTRDQAIAMMSLPDGDKSITLFRALVAAKLNVWAGANSACVSATISAADAWMAKYGPVGSKVKASSQAWKLGEPLYQTLDSYNNGYLCAPHRD
jgi:hypothetical protein